MYKVKKINALVIITIMLCFGFSYSFSAIKQKPSNDEKEDKILRTGRLYDNQRNTVSNIQFYTSNYGIFGLDIDNNIGGGYWPRGSLNQYIFGGGIWFGAMKRRPDNPNEYRKYVVVSYNPNNGKSWMVPGEIEDGDNILTDGDAIKKYRTYFSTDFKPGDGTPLNAADGPNWPIWDASSDPNDSLKVARYFGYYISDINKRNTNTYPKGPAFISGEDIFCIFKDTDLNEYDGGAARRRGEGYPLRLQFEQTIYSWGFGDYRDFIFLRYAIINKSKDTLLNCWMAPVMDIDIARAPNTHAGANNDRVRFYEEDPSLNLAVQWTNTDRGEKGYGFGYLGFDFLESPAVHRCEEQLDTVINGVPGIYCAMCSEYETQRVVTLKDTVINGDTVQIEVIEEKENCVKKIYFSPQEEDFVRKDRRFYGNRFQLGLKTFRNWPIEADISDDEPRYNYLASQVRDGDDGPGDKRFLMATGPFHFRPGDTVQVVVGIILAGTAIREEADGSTEDLAELVRKDKFAQKVYDDNFRAPVPPDRASLYWEPLNNGIKVYWDATSELSKDLYEKGLDFMGYRLYRARRSDLDTFDVNTVAPAGQYTSGKGPFGWRQIASWSIPTPFLKSVYRAGLDQNNTSYPLIDSLRIVGPVIDQNGKVDSFAVKVMRVGRGIILAGPDRYILENLTNRQAVYPIIMGIDTALLAQPWGPYYKSLVNDNDLPLWHDPYNPNRIRHKLLDSILVGKVVLNRALLSYNPFLWRKETVNIDPRDTASLQERYGDTVYVKSSYRTVVVNGTPYLMIDRMVPVNYQTVMRDTLHLRQALDSLYWYIKRGWAKTEFPEFEQSNEACLNVIEPYMRRITNNRTYIDIGDDNRNGIVQTNVDPTKTEKIINNVEYYYRILSYDEGDYNQPTPSKLNDGFPGLPNVKKTIPRAASVGDKLKFDVIYVDSAKIGGLYNFEFFAVNKDRAQQLFAGDTLELEFQPYWNVSQIQLLGRPVARRFGLYAREMRLKNLRTNNILYDGITYFEATPCNILYRGSFTEDAFSYVLSDTVIVDTVTGKTVTFGTWYNNEKVYRSGKFTTGDFTKEGYCYVYPMSQEMYGTLGFSFDFTMEQRGGRYRGDTCIKPPYVATPVKFMKEDTLLSDISVVRSNQNKVLLTQWVANQVVGQEFNSYYPREFEASFNNGPAEYLVTFKPGGVETMTLQFGTPVRQNTFDVPYLTVEVVNNIGFTKDIGEGKTLSVSYPEPVLPMELPDSLVFLSSNADWNVQRYYPDPRNLQFDAVKFIGKFNMSSYAWVNGRQKHTFLELRKQQAWDLSRPAFVGKPTNVGKQNRYYLSAVSRDGVDTVDFVNVLQASGVFFAFDYANKGRRFIVDQFPEWERDSTHLYVYGGRDFQPGDQVILKTTGGVLGMPMPGAKVKCVVSSYIPEDEKYTDEMLNQIQVVPNPYYLSHQAQKSPYDAKIFFTKLPKRCTIDIYTVNGDLVVSLNHNEQSDNPEQEAVEVWDLLSRNGQRVQSQTLVAVIKTPNGAQTVKNFSLVVGGTRIITE